MKPTSSLQSHEELAFFEQQLSFLELSSHGDVSFKNFTREELLSIAEEEFQRVFHQPGASYGGLRLRDIRIILPEASEPVFVVRKLACLVNLDSVRALLLPNRILVIKPEGEVEEELVTLLKTKFEQLMQGILDSNLTYVPPPSYSVMEKEDENVKLSVSHDEEAFLDSKRRHSVLLQEEDIIQERGILGSLRARSVELVNPSLQLSRRGGLPSAKETFPDRSSPKQQQHPVSSVKLTHHSTLGKTVHHHEHFELYALEAVLWTAMKLLEREQDILWPKVMKTTYMARKERADSALEFLRNTRIHANRLLANSQAQLAALTKLTLDDEFMNLLQFAHTNNDPHHEHHDHQESMNILLQSYIQRFESLIQEFRYFVEELDDSELTIEVGLDKVRNKLLKINMYMNAIAAFSGIGAFVSALFGTNLNSMIQNIYNPPLFWIVFALLLIIFCVEVIIMSIFVKFYL